MTAQLGNVDCYAELSLVGRMKDMLCARIVLNKKTFNVFRMKMYQFIAFILEEFLQICQITCSPHFYGQ